MVSAVARSYGAARQRRTVCGLNSYRLTEEAPPSWIPVPVRTMHDCSDGPRVCDEPSSLVVGVSLCDSAPLLWRHQDLRQVRSRGLVGALLGSLPRTPRQNGRLGRPLLLLPEEETLLRELGAAAALPAAEQVGPAGGGCVRFTVSWPRVTCCLVALAGRGRGGAAWAEAGV